MLKEMFLGNTPSSFQINPIVKAFILSESFLWSAWNFLSPIMAVFAVEHLVGGGIETAGFAYSIHLITRVIFELTSGRYLAKSSTHKKILVIWAGLFLVSGAYIGMAYANTIIAFYLAMAAAGMGFGIISPAKNSLFSTHLDKNKESMEWGITDAAVFIAIALAAALGGLIASKYGFQVLFLLAAAVNLLAVIPYAILINQKEK